MNLTHLYQTIRKHSENICKPLQVEDYVVQIVPFASPAKWHLAHTTWFFETFILKNHFDNYVEYDSDFSFLFNSYYNNVGDRILRTNRGNLTRPSVDEIYKYRKHVDEKMMLFIENHSDSAINDLIILGLNHEQQHQELLLTDIKYMFGHNPLFPVYDENFSDSISENKIDETLDLVKIEAGIYQIGYHEDAFSYDNELGVHSVYLNEFSIQNSLVSNGEYLEFMEAGGYTDFNLWLDDGWSWINSNQIEAPLYWHNIDGVWHHYTLSGFKKVDMNAAVCHVSYYEAKAYAEWKNERLPTEFEWEIASKKLNWGNRWEWTDSAYLPYPNFKKANGAVGEYNGKFMSSQMVLRGASVATSQDHSRNTYRNFFHPDDRWQFTGIRLVD